MTELDFVRYRVNAVAYIQQVTKLCNTLHSSAKKPGKLCEDDTLENSVHCEAILSYFRKFNTPPNRQVNTRRLWVLLTSYPLLSSILDCSVLSRCWFPFQDFTPLQFRCCAFFCNDRSFASWRIAACWAKEPWPPWSTNIARLEAISSTVDGVSIP